MTIKKLLRKMAECVFQSSWYPNKKILLESVPDLSSQTYPVFQYMIQQGLNKQYKFYWLVENSIKYRNHKQRNVFYVNYKPENAFQKLHRFYLHMTSRAILYSTKYVGKIFEKQLQVYLIHGSPIKSRKKHSPANEVNESDIVISLSDYLKDMVLEDPEELHLKNSNVIVTGYPRNDYLFSKVDILKQLELPPHRKVVIWMPTFRVTNGGGRVDCNRNYPLGLPCLNTKEECVELNKLLSALDILLIIKPHPVQDMTKIISFDLSNVVILTDDMILAHNLQPYEVLGGTDAMITDYSSVYFDYMLTGHPIGLTTDDYEEYKNDTGFCFENLYDHIVGHQIPDFSEFCTFIKQVSEEVDDSKTERDALLPIYHKFMDNSASERVSNLILDEIEARYNK